MDIFSIGSMNTYTKNLKMQTQWQLKQQSGDLTSHKKSLDEWLSASQTPASYGQAEHGDSQLRSIQQKLFAGKKLTAEERQYLKAKDPQTYAKLEAAEQEQKAYERELKRCKTKEDVQRLKTTYLNASLAVVKAVENNPNIGIEKKLEIMVQEKQRCDRLEESTMAFVRRGEYAKLPTDAEKAKADKEQAEETRPAERTEEAAELEEAAKTEETAGEQDAAGTEDPVQEEAHTEAKQPAIRVESPEARKVRRAKAKAAYTEPSASMDAPASLDIQA